MKRGEIEYALQNIDDGILEEVAAEKLKLQKRSQKKRVFGSFRAAVTVAAVILIIAAAAVSIIVVSGRPHVVPGPAVSSDPRPETPLDAAIGEKDALKGKIEKALVDLDLKVSSIDLGESALRVELAASGSPVESETYAAALINVERCLTGGGYQKVNDIKIIKLGDIIENVAGFVISDKTVYVEFLSEGDERCTKADVRNLVAFYRFLAYEVPSEDYDFVDMTIKNASGKVISHSGTRFSKDLEIRTPKNDVIPVSVCEKIKSVIGNDKTLISAELENRYGIPEAAIVIGFENADEIWMYWLDDVYNLIIYEIIDSLNVACCSISAVDSSTGEEIMYLIGDADLGSESGWVAPGAESHIGGPDTEPEFDE